MSKNWPLVMALVTLPALLMFQNCGQSPSSSLSPNDANNGAASPTVSIMGTVTPSSIDGCQFLVCGQVQQQGDPSSASGSTTKCIVPVSVDPSVLKVGNVLSIQGQVRTDMVNVCMAAPIVQANKVEVLSSQ